MDATGRFPMGKKRRYDCAESSEIARIHNDNITFLTRILITIENLVLAIIAGIVLIIVLI
jgi:hypothetical protein